MVSVVIVVPVRAYDIQPWDNALLNNIYDAIDQKIAEGNSNQMLALYDMMEFFSVKYSSNEQSMYFVEKMEEYLRERLFRATDASTFVCLLSHVQKGDTVTLGYDLRDDDGILISLATNDNTYEQPSELAFNAGVRQIVYDIDQAVLGMSITERKHIYFAPGDVYGSWHEWLVSSYPRQTVEAVATQPLEVGATFTATFQDSRGKTLKKQWAIYSLDTETVQLDFNHPLADKAVSGVVAVKWLFKKCH